MPYLTKIVSVYARMLWGSAACLKKCQSLIIVLLIVMKANSTSNGWTVSQVGIKGKLKDGSSC
jgi:hypothetical protein